MTARDVLEAVEDTREEPVSGLHPKLPVGIGLDPAPLTLLRSPASEPERIDFDAIVQRVSTVPPPATGGELDVFLPPPPALPSDAPALASSFFPPPLAAPVEAPAHGPNRRVASALLLGAALLGGVGAAFGARTTEAPETALDVTAPAQADLGAAQAAPESAPEAEPAGLEQPVAPASLATAVTTDPAAAFVPTPSAVPTAATTPSLTAASTAAVAPTVAEAPVVAEAPAEVAPAAIEPEAPVEPPPPPTTTDLMHAALVETAPIETLNGAHTRVDTSIPEVPARSVVNAALRAVQGEVDRCVETAGTVHVRVTLEGATGRVTAAHPVGAHAGTPEAACIAQAVRGVSVSPFRRASMSIDYPFVVR